MAIPTLLMPNGSRDRSGPVTPTVGANVTVVDGAWRSTGAGGSSSRGVTVPRPVGLEDDFTILVRALWETDSTASYAIHTNSVITNFSGLAIGRLSNGSAALVVSSTFVEDGPLSVGEWHTLAVRYSGGIASLFVEGILMASAATPAPTYTDNALVVGRSSASHPLRTAAALIYDAALSDAEIHRISTMPEAWTWESLMPRIGGVRTTHQPAPFALASTHQPAPFALASTHQPAPFAARSEHGAAPVAVRSTHGEIK